MSKEISTLDELKNEIQDGQKVGNSNILFLDVSSACIGYTICSVDFTHKKAVMKTTGAIWLDPNWEHAEKYSYVFNMIVNYFWIAEQIDHITVEQYSINPNKMVGVAVVPEMMGVIKAAGWEHGIKVSNILPQTWRSILAIKPDVTVNAKGKKERDFKEPTKRYVDGIMTVPPQIKSNITSIMRQTPYDLYDAVCISIAWLKKLGFTTDVRNVQINPHIQ